MPGRIHVKAGLIDGGRESSGFGRERQIRPRPRGTVGSLKKKGKKITVENKNASASEGARESSESERE